MSAALPSDCGESPQTYRPAAPPQVNAAPLPADPLTLASTAARPAALPDDPAALARAAAHRHSREEAVRRADVLTVSLRAAALRLTIPLARAAAAIVRDRAWREFGFARAADFARERLGRSERWLTDLAALHECLQTLPDLDAALTGSDGGRPIGRVGALHIGRIASPGTVPAWVALARHSTVRELREAVRRAHAAGSDAPHEETAPGDIDSRNLDPVALDPSDHVLGDPPAGDPIRGETPPGADARCAEEDDPASRTLVRLRLPRAIRAAFDEGLDLFRAVEGTEATVTSFIDALVAETAAGDYPADARAEPLVPGPSLATIESALARSTEHWRDLNHYSALSWSLAKSDMTLERFEALSLRAGHGGPAALVSQMRSLIDLENEIEVLLGCLLAEMSENGAWSCLRFSGVGHYAEERLRLSRTAAEDRARAARALRRFPHLRGAYERGGLGLDAVVTIARILNDAYGGGTHPGGSAIERVWVERATEATVKRLRDEARLIMRRAAEDGAAGHAGSDDGRPAPDPIDQGRAPAPPGDAEWHASLRREPGTARRRVLRFGLSAAGIGAASENAHPPMPDVFLRLRLPDELATRFLAAIESARKRLSDEADSVTWDNPFPAAAEGPAAGGAACVEGPDRAASLAAPAHGASTFPAAPARRAVATTPPLPSLAAARTFSIRCHRVPAWVGLLALLEDFVLTWDTADGARKRPGDAILIRDGWRCAAPGCTSRRNLEIHHVVYRSRLGGDDDANRSCLCRFHHQRGEHGGLASCTGEAPLGLLWRLGRNDLGLWYRNERRVGAVPGSREAHPWPGE